MPTATTLVRRAALRDAVADEVALDHAARRRAAGSLTTAGGFAFDLALARAAPLEDGDALRLDDGRLVQVRAAEEALLEVHAENPVRLTRLAWQLGSNHVPAEIEADRLYVPAAAAGLVRGAGCHATPVTRAFRPERDAHDHSQCGHDHSHDHAHSHYHAHAHDHAHAHAHGHDHDHHDAQGHDPRHGHSHDH